MMHIAGRPVAEIAELLLALPLGAGRAAGAIVAFGIRNFWQSHPAQLDIRGADGDAATMTLWVWSPEAPQYSASARRVNPIQSA